MNTPCLFRFGNSLNTVYARFIFQRVIYSVSRNLGNESFVSFERTLAKIQNGYFPAFDFRIPLMHAGKVASENGGFIAACARARLYSGFMHLLYLRFGLGLG